MFVKEWMTSDPKIVRSTTPVMEAMHILRDGGFRRLPVVDDGKLVGIVTDRDLKEATPSKASTLSVYELNYLLSKLTVGEVMVKPVLTVAPDDPIENAALIMEEKKISGLPVIEGEKVVGIVTITDILSTFVDALGLKQGGKRLTVYLPDEPGILQKVARAGPPSNISAVVTAGVREGQRRELVLRVTGEGADDFANRLEAEGVEIADVR